MLVGLSLSGTSPERERQLSCSLWGPILCLEELGPTLTSRPSAAQEARNKFEEAERSLKEMEESIR